MTDIVFITDIHGKYEVIPKIFEEEEPDYVLIGGDLTDFGPLDGVIPALEEIPAPTFVIPGNCDPKEIVQVIDASDAISLHKKSIDLGNITITGLGGSNTTPFNTLFELSEEEIAAASGKDKEEPVEPSGDTRTAAGGTGRYRRGRICTCWFCLGCSGCPRV